MAADGIEETGSHPVSALSARRTNLRIVNEVLQARV